MRHHGVQPARSSRVSHGRQPACCCAPAATILSPSACCAAISPPRSRKALPSRHTTIWANYSKSKATDKAAAEEFRAALALSHTYARAQEDLKRVEH